MTYQLPLSLSVQHVHGYLVRMPTTIDSTLKSMVIVTYPKYNSYARSDHAFITVKSWQKSVFWKRECINTYYLKTEVKILLEFFFFWKDKPNFALQIYRIIIIKLTLFYNINEWLAKRRLPKHLSWERKSLVEKILHEFEWRGECTEKTIAYDMEKKMKHFRP